MAALDRDLVNSILKKLGVEHPDKLAGERAEQKLALRLSKQGAPKGLTEDEKIMVMDLGIDPDEGPQGKQHEVKDESTEHGHEDDAELEDIADKTTRRRGENTKSPKRKGGTKTQGRKDSQMNRKGKSRKSAHGRVEKTKHGRAGKTKKATGNYSPVGHEQSSRRVLTQLFQSRQSWPRKEIVDKAMKVSGCKVRAVRLMIQAMRERKSIREFVNKDGVKILTRV